MRASLFENRLKEREARQGDFKAAVSSLSPVRTHSFLSPPSPSSATSAAKVVEGNRILIDLEATHALYPAIRVATVSDPCLVSRARFDYFKTSII